MTPRVTVAVRRARRLASSAVPRARRLAPSAEAVDRSTSVLDYVAMLLVDKGKARALEEVAEIAAPAA